MAARITAYLVALIVGTTVIAGLIVGAQREDEAQVDLIVVNGRVYSADPETDGAQAIAIQGNKILQIGTTREIHRLRRTQTVVVDAKGGTILPGFEDAQANLLRGGLALQEVDLSAARTLADVEEEVRAWAAINADREWVTGRGWSDAAFAGAALTKERLDEIVPDRPAVLRSHDGHTAWANSRALKLAGITRRTPNPAHGTVAKDGRNGEPTGILEGSATALITAAMPEPDRAQRIAALRAAIRDAHRRGITSVQDAGVAPDDVALYEEMRTAGGLKLRISAALNADYSASAEDLDRLDQLRARHVNDAVLKTGMVKIVVDDAIEADRAATRRQQSRRRAAEESPRMTLSDLERLVTELDRRGWQIVLHAEGERAVRIALDALDRASAQNPQPARGRRHRIEHIQAVDPADVPRFAKLGIVATMPPYQLSEDGDRDPSNASFARAERGTRSGPYGAIARSGGQITFGSDWPVTMNPLLGLQAAVTRAADSEPDAAADRLTLQDALDAYTRTSAWASFEEQRRGTIARDMLADIVVLSKDIFALPAARLAEATVEVTIFDGKIVFQRSSDSDD